MDKAKQNIIKEICEETNTLIDDTENITELLLIWNELDDGLKELKTTNEKIQTKIKNYLKEREWTHYKDEETKISVSITELEIEQMNKSQLKIMLSNTQLAQVINIKMSESMDIITPKRRKELSKIVRK